jgi:clan AA aspartic protease (TIGR02281 family)
MRATLTILLLLTAAGPAVADPFAGPTVATVPIFTRPAPAPEAHRVKFDADWRVAVEVNGALTADFVVDTGSAPVMLSADLFAKLRSAGAIRDADMDGMMTFTMADGVQRQWRVFMIRSLKVAGVVVENVSGAASTAGRPLLGRSFLQRLQSWHVDNISGELVLGKRR